MALGLQGDQCPGFSYRKRRVGVRERGERDEAEGAKAICTVGRNGVHAGI